MLGGRKAGMGEIFTVEAWYLYKRGRVAHVSTLNKQFSTATAVTWLIRPPPKLDNPSHFTHSTTPNSTETMSGRGKGGKVCQSH
jgi:hypothetical protein